MTKKKTEQFKKEPFMAVEGAEFINVPQQELVQHACGILKQVRAKPRDIAWAWAFLCALERDEPFGMDEKSYRAIYDLREWVLKQGFQTFDKDGMPTAPSKGVSAVKPDDIEDLMMLRVADVKAKAKAQELDWADLHSVAAASILQVQRNSTDAGISLSYLRLGEWHLHGLSEEQLKNRLSKADREAKYLLPARCSKGARGSRNASTWNPAKLANILTNKGNMIERQAEHMIAKHFPSYFDEWKKLREEANLAAD